MATRRERVVIELEDGLTAGVLREAAAVAVLNRELDKLGRESTGAKRSMDPLSRETLPQTARSSDTTGKSIDRLSGRLSLLAQTTAVLGPSLVPIGAVGIPAAAGLANELGGVALGAGTALLAFHGLGDAMTALNRAALEPTTTNLKAAHDALEKLPPAARSFAHELAVLQPTLLGLRQAAGAGLFPGLTNSITLLSTRADDAERILHRVGSVLGELSREGAHSLAGPGWDDFFRFVSQEAPVTLANLGHAVGDVVHGLAQLWIAFAPLDQDFTGFINKAADGFDRWASGLSKTQGFADFIDYLHTNGPLVADAVEAIANAVLQIVEAAAPLGGPVLQSLTAVAKAVAAIADSKVGPTLLATVTALSLLSRAQSTFGKVSETSWIQAIRGADTYQARVSAIRGPATRSALALTGLGVAASGVGDHFKFANTASLALTGSIAGPWGAAVGAGAGLLIDFTHKQNDSAAATVDFTSTLNQQTGAITENTRLLAAQTLQQDGSFRAAAQLGITVSTLTSAALGQKDALAEVNGQLAFYLQQTKPGYTAGGNTGFIDPEKVKLARDLGNELGLVGDNLKADQSKTRELSAAMDGNASKASKAKAAHHALRLELQAEKQAAAETAQKFLTLGDNLNNAKVSLDKWVHQLAAEARALENFGTNAKTAADKGLRDGLIKQLQEAGPEGALRMRQLANATQAEIAKANRAWGAGKKAASDYQEATAYVANHPPTLYVNGVPESIRELRELQSALAALRDHTIRVTTVRTTGGHSVAGYADGGTVGGAPRRPYGDKVIIKAAPGEEIISNRYGQADQFRADRASGRIPGYADGGTVARSYQRADPPSSRMSGTQAGASRAPEIDYDRLTRALLAARPMYGDVHMQPHDYGDFLREMGQDRTRAAMGSVASRW